MSTEGRRIFWITVLLASVLIMAAVSLVVQSFPSQSVPVERERPSPTVQKDACKEYVEYVDTEGVPALVPACSIPPTYRNSDK